jgi:hypothetical protein
MWAIISTAAAKVIGAIASFANAAIRWAGIFFAYRLGKRKAQQESLEDVVETKDKQLEDAARPPRSRSDVVKRMLDGEL